MIDEGKKSRHEIAENVPRVNEFRRIIRILFGRVVVIIGLVIILLVIITAIFAPLLAPYDPYAQDLPQRLLKPSTQHLLGTDSLGRDLLSRLIYGSRNSLMVVSLLLVLRQHSACRWD